MDGAMAAFQPLDALSLQAWVGMAPAGASMTYHVGNLQTDRRGNGQLGMVARLALTLAGYRRPPDRASNTLDWVLRAPQLVILVQVRVGPGCWAYKAIRTAVPVGGLDHASVSVPRPSDARGDRAGAHLGA